MDPDHDGEFGFRVGGGGGVDVEVEAVFGGAGVEEDVVVPDVPLFTAGAELCRVA